MRTCIEIKKTLDGKIRKYRCELINLHSGKGILKYVLDQPFQVDALQLSIRTITYAFYWETAPFTLYKWYRPDGIKIADYFNIADTIQLTPKKFVWRDLALDILVFPGGEYVILDEDEIPADIDSATKDRIAFSKIYLLQRFRSIVDDTDKDVALIIDNHMGLSL